MDNLNVGTTLKLAFGNGTQFFHVTKISAKGKLFGVRLVNLSRLGGKYAHWEPSSIASTDVRILGEAKLPCHAPGVPILPAKLSRGVLKEMKAKVDALKAIWEAKRAEHDAFLANGGELSNESLKPQNEAGSLLYKASGDYRSAKNWDSLI